MRKSILIVSVLVIAGSSNYVQAGNNGHGIGDACPNGISPLGCIQTSLADS